jgi:FKBP-type peptidyl-prolyl cis-trans isomerase FklB
MLLGSAVAQQSTQTQAPPAANGSQAAPAPSAPAATPIPELPTQKDRISYAIGMNIGKGLHRDSIDIDTNLLMRGLKDAQAGSKMLMTDDQAQAAITELQNQIREKMEAEKKAAGETNRKEGNAFLEANKTKPGVQTTPSGLQYKVLKEGTGPKPTATDTVVCNYKGTLLSGKEFDSSYTRGQPATFPVNGVIKGWTEALQLMPVGSKYQLFIPPDLAYGARGAGDAIGPDQTLIFEVELMSIVPKDQKEQK